ncbi:MAG: oxygen-independent coproporphyrinogen III oxidase [Elusimicrobiota bacterium]
MNNLPRDKDINLLKHLMRKYENIYAMYVEYPHKSAWTTDFDDNVFRIALKNLFSNDKYAPLLLYVHIPFCSKQCFYCTCHTYITNNYEKIKEYLNSLYCEIDLLREVFDKYSIKPNFKEIHLGGGSPTILLKKEFDTLIEKIQSIADIKKLTEFAIEIDPRASTIEMLKYYHEKGINRISFGVQDFDPDVQKAINRIQPVALVENLLTPEIRSYFHGINFDIMWGLPKQTSESFRKTIDTAIKLSPDRISLLLLHYAPEVKKHQKKMNQSEFPSIEEQTMFFHEAVETLQKNGYIRIGLDHFAKSTDTLAKALRNNTLRWNNLGYTSGNYYNIIGLGPWSASTITSEYYFQNIYSLKEYENAVKNLKFPVYRRYKLNNDDIIRRDIIHNFRIYFSVDFSNIEKKYNIIFNKYFEKELAMINDLVSDGILKLTEKNITITELGKYFTMQVCHVFDNHK